MRLKYIDVLKAIAIIAVVLYHAGLTPNGYLGVDLFLVIVGYLTTRTLYTKVVITDSPGGEYITFEVSRIIRLLPPLLVAGLACMLVGYMTMLPDDYENLSESVIATNFFGNNILGAITTGNYWDVVNDFKPLMHTWYVGVIMQFYLVYPIFFYLSRLDKRNAKGTLLTMLASVAFISLLVYFVITDTTLRFYYLPSRFFEFAVGGIAALLYNPQEDKPFGKGFVYVCYILLIALMFVSTDVIPAIIRLVAVVGLSCVLLCSKDVLENNVTSNAILSKIGAASYSIFIWHQVILAFYRYTATSKFSVGSYALLLIATIILSWLSYRFIEQGITRAIKSKRGKIAFYSAMVVVFISLTVFSGIIYLRAGVVRDVPELCISKNNVHRGMHAAYCDRGYQFDKPFETDKPHWLVVGNSFGRDFINIILESSIRDSVEVSYITMDDLQSRDERFSKADLVFFSVLGLDYQLVSEVEVQCVKNDFDPKKMIIVGEKNFGESNGQVYAKRKQNDYFDQFVPVVDYHQFIVCNEEFREHFGEQFLDMMALVINKDKKVRVFTPTHLYISEDCRHLTQGGASFYAELIDWNRFLHQ